MPRLKKSLGQHFLNNPATAARIADLAAINSSDCVLEIGPGAGALTTHLVERQPARLMLLEKDDYYAAHHSQRWQSHTAVEVWHGDALQYTWQSCPKPCKIVGNLPYNIASPLMWDIVSQTQGLARAVFMVQREVAERVCAAPHSKAYGALSVWIQSYVRPHFAFVVPPGAFTPPPRVDSAVVIFEPLPSANWPENPAALSKTLKLCFQQRRKQLQSILKRGGFADAADCLTSLGLKPEARPEELSVPEFRALCTKLYGKEVDFAEKPV